MHLNFTKTLCLVVAILCAQFAFAQKENHKKDDKKKKTVSIYDIDTLINPVPLQRSLFFDKVKKQQKRADAFDGKIDDYINFNNDSISSRTLTNSLLREISKIEIMIENLPIADKFTENQTKLGYLRSLEQVLIRFNDDNKVDPLYYKRLVNNFRDMVIAKYEGNLSAFVRGNVNVYTMGNSQMLGDDDKEFLCEELAKKDPTLLIRRLPEFINKPCADIVIAGAAKINPDEIFNYASSTNAGLKNAVERNTDPLVKTIVKIVRESKSPLKAKTFLHDIHNGTLSIAEVDKITEDQDLFFKNLVRLKIENNDLGNASINSELEYRSLRNYVRVMDELHEKPEAVRFKCIENLSPEAIYYIIIYGQEEIYTSSFTGAFKRLMEKMKPMTGDEFLGKLHYDRFRTFVRMCAGFNRLDQFLATFTEEKKKELLSSFIANLDKGKEDDLEDAVDVADAFGSIEDSSMIAYLREEVKKNYEVSYQHRSKKGLQVYALLATLFDGAKDTVTNETAEERSKKLNLPPINYVPYATLTHDSAAVVEQFFFYGDEDGKMSYASFLNNFKGPKWKMTTTKYWVNITSTSGRPISVYANLPLAEPEDEDAQRALNKYLDENAINPAILIHRGHSYHLPTTLERLNDKTKVVVLGSCGGYHNLSTILTNSPDAQIISTKQTGAMAVNEPILRALNDNLGEGTDVNWVNMWKRLDGEFKGKPAESTFRDYVPPHKNLGAIFIKAYRRLEEQNG
ncbi:hypothetical protein [Rurimicrobium arvi]|uniref:Uncharacterized protein n=1 Tax=Rurimicrobium arvi TaxID=2049916 RepID=A0ABP8MQG7_9BACT